MPIVYALVLAALVNACAHTYRDRVDRELAAWVDQSADRLVEAWGAPRSTYTMDDGRKVLSYQDTSFVSRSLGPVSFYPRPDVYSYSDSCKINFYTDALQKRIESYSFAGSITVCWDMIDTALSTVQSTPRPTPPAADR